MTLATNWVDNIGMFVNAAYLNQLGTEHNASIYARTLSGTFASRPAAAATNSGAFYFSTDTDAVYKSDGTTWTKIRIGRAGGPVGDVPTTGWTAVNMQTGWTWAADLDSMLFTAPTISGDHLGYQYRAYPGSPFTLTVNMDALLQVQPPVAATSSYDIAGIVISDGTLAVQFGPIWGNYGAGGVWAGAGQYLGNWRWASGLTSATQPNQVYLGDRWALGVPNWYRFVDDGTNRKMQYSFNGFDWLTFVTESRTAYLTPTRIGIGVGNNAGAPALLRVRSWNGVT